MEFSDSMYIMRNDSEFSRSFFFSPIKHTHSSHSFPRPSCYRSTLSPQPSVIPYNPTIKMKFTGIAAALAVASTASAAALPAVPLDSAVNKLTSVLGNLDSLLGGVLGGTAPVAQLTEVKSGQSCIVHHKSLPDLTVL